VFTLLRVVQGLCMSTAFALTLAYLGEHASAADTASAFAAYITGNVASNLFGRLLAAGVVDHLGLAANFYVFATLNLSGAVLVWFTVERTPPMLQTDVSRASPLKSFLVHLANPALRAAFATGFVILFAFIGTFTYVNFVLVREPFSVGMMMLGIVYFVFLPSIVTTPLAGRVVARFGTRPTLWGSFAVAAAGLPLLLSQSLAALLAGLGLSASGPSSPRRRQPVLSGAQPRATEAPQAAFISRAISSVAWWAAPCWARSSTAWAGRPA
jgi:predicted MFS family arabinose efflux permease